MLLKCSGCDYVANQELADTKWKETSQDTTTTIYGNGAGLLLKVVLPQNRNVNGLKLMRAVRKFAPKTETLLPISSTLQSDSGRPSAILFDTSVAHLAKDLEQTLCSTASLIDVASGDPCPRCDDGQLNSVQAIELGHTFHLGTKYSVPLAATFTAASGERLPVQMGCHGIGVSRLIGALAEAKHDEKGLRWPTGFAPYKVAIIVHPKSEDAGEQVFDALNALWPNDVILDDRSNKSMSWKMRDADLVGYEYSIIIGSEWKEARLLELRNRNTGERHLCSLMCIKDYVGSDHIFANTNS